MNTLESLEMLRDKLKVLEGHKIQIIYDNKVVLEKVNPTADEIILALYASGGDK